MKLHLKILTPLHIGTGMELEPIDYVITDNHYYRVPQKIALEFFQQYKLLNNFTKWIEKTTEEISKLEEKKKSEKGNRDLNQQLSHLRQKFNLLEFSNQNQKSKEFKQFINTHKGVIKIPLNGQVPDKKIREQIKDGTGKPYIPGTSIKGAMRTALMYHWMLIKNPINEIKEIFNQDFSKNERPEKLKVTFANRIENLTFYCGIEKENRVDNSDEKFDLLKLLIVSDGKVIHSENPFIIIRTYLYLRDNTRQKQSPWVEAIAAGNSIEFSIDFNIEFLFALKDKIQNDSITIDGQRQWIGIETKTKEIFNLDLHSLTRDNLQEQKQKVIQHILNVVSTFSQKQMDWNEKWKEKVKLKSQNVEHGLSTETFLKNKLDFSFSQNKKCINLGFASGFTGITEFIYLLGSDELKNAFKQIMEKFGLGDNPQAKKKRQNDIKARKNVQNYIANPDKFPKSKTMYETKEKKIQPLGWLEILTEKPLTNEKRLPNQNTTSPSSESNHHSVQPIKFKPNFYPGKIQQIPAQVIKSGKPNIVKLLIEGIDKDIELPLDGYHSELKVGQYILVKIDDLRKNGELRKISFVKEIK